MSNSSQNNTSSLQERFEAISENGMDCVIIVAPEGHVIHVSGSTTKILGYTSEEVMSFKLADIVHSENVESAMKAFEKAVQRPGVPIHDDLLRVKHKNGSWVWVESVLTNLVHDPVINGIVNNFRDVTNLVLAKQKVDEANKRMLLATRDAGIGIWEMNMETGLMIWNDVMYNLYGVDSETFDCTVESWLALIDPEGQQKIANIGDTLNSSNIKFEINFEITRPNGIKRFIKSTGHMLHNEPGQAQVLIGTNQDITELKKTQEEIKSNHQLLDINEKIKYTGNWKWDLKTNDVQWSANLYGIFGVDTGEKITFDKYFSYVHPEDQARAKVHVDEAFELLYFTKLIHRILLDDGSIKTVLLMAEFSYDTEGNPVEVIGICQDITQQKVVEYDLLKKNQLLNIAQKITKIGNWQWDLTTDKVIWTNNLYKIFQVDENTPLVFDTYLSFAHPKDEKKVSEHFAKSLEEKNFQGITHRILLNDGTVKTIQIFGEIIFDDLGKMAELLGTCQDITEQKMIENKFRGLLESAPDAMVIINENNNIELVNSETEKMFGYTKSEMVEQSVKLLFPNEYKEKLIALKNEQIISPPTPSNKKTFELQGIKKNGETFPIEINLGTLHSDEGILISASIRDITTRKQTEMMLRNMAALKAKNEEMEHLAYITSHDLREPLLTMKKYSQVLNSNFKDSLGEQGNVLLNTIIRSAERMETKIKDLLDYSQLGQAKLLMELDCNSIVNSVTEDLNSLIVSKNAEIIIGVLPHQMQAYPTELQLIFQNLINNAIKFSDKERSPIVQISSKKINEGWKFQISDNGIGIHKKDHDKIFAFFQRLHNSSDYEGSGIGLAQVKKLVELHNGKVQIESELGKGTTFTFTIMTKKL